MPLTDRELAERHRYVTKHGRAPAPGVTSVDITHKPALMWGAARLTAETAVLEGYRRDELVAEHREKLAGKPINRLGSTDEKVSALSATDEEVWVDYLRTRFDVIWRAKADKGSRVHDHALAWASGDEIDALPDEQGYLDALERFFEDYSPEFVAAEAIVLSPSPCDRPELEYGGRLDFVAYLSGPKFEGLYLGDYKTGGRYRVPVALQAAGLLAAEGYALYSPMGAVLDKLRPLEAKQAVTVYLRDDGTYELHDPFEGTTRSEATQAFYDLRSAMNWTRKMDKIDWRTK